MVRHSMESCVTCTLFIKLLVNKIFPYVCVNQTITDILPTKNVPGAEEKGICNYSRYS